MATTGFHSRTDSQWTTIAGGSKAQRSIEYGFSLHQHPYATQLVGRLLEDSLAGLQAADTEPPPAFQDAAFFNGYQPASAVAARPVKDLDFLGGAYAVYNWELFFHVPLDGRDPPEQERALRGRAALVPLRLRPDRRQRRADARAVLEGHAVPDHRRRADRGAPDQPLDARQRPAGRGHRRRPSRRGTTRRSGRTSSPATGRRPTCSRR